jgi:hypothetical protein
MRSVMAATVSCGLRADVVLTVPYAAQRSAVEEVADLLAGKILIDTTVPLMPPKVARVQLAERRLCGRCRAGNARELGSGGVRVPECACAIYCSTWRTTWIATCSSAAMTSRARETVIQLIAAIGLRGIHAGPIANSAATEALTSVLISINSRYKVPGAGIRITGLSGRTTLTRLNASRRPHDDNA